MSKTVRTTGHPAILPSSDTRSSAFLIGLEMGRSGKRCNNPYEVGTADYAALNEGYAAGHRRFSKAGRFGGGTQGERRRARFELKTRYGCKAFKVAKRCPLCGTNNMTRQPKTDVCLGCAMKGTVNA